MFEISWSELLVLAVVALIFIGPKDLPIFFNTIGKYAGMVRRQANEFRRHFDDAMREAEMESLRKELDGVREDMERTTREAARAAEDDIAKVKADTETAAAPIANTDATPTLALPPAKSGA
jgi:sec-independent protein translocase protein TatB